MKKIILLALALCLLGGFVIWKTFVAHPPGDFTVRQKDIYKFSGVSGPEGKSVLPEIHPSAWEKYRPGSASRLAVLLTDPNSAWLGLAHGLKTMGVPFLLTRDYRQALQHPVVLVYPLVSGKVLDAAAIRALVEFPKKGGTLIGINVFGGLQETCGFAEAVESKKHHEIRFNAHEAGITLTDPKEQVISLGRRKSEQPPDESEAAIGTVSYSKPAEPPLAVYEDGAAAIIHHRVGAGQAYAFGLDLGSLALRGYGNRNEAISRTYVNQYEPTLDVLLRLLKAIYQRGARHGVTLETVPFNRSLTVLLTHDVDFAASVQNSLSYAEYEQSQGVKATYFIQTKYIRDYNDEIFMNEANLPAMRKLAGMGMETASHTVCHTRLFARLAPGTGEERYPTYTPFVQERMTVYHASILGELRVSKFLLEHFTGAQVRSFRPGGLSNPFQLPEALEATQYLYSSSVTANDSFSHLPFQLNYSRGYEAESPIFEFPVTIEDEEPPEMGSRLNAAIEVARKISNYGGLVNILIHPNITGHKLDFERGFVTAFKDSAWFGTVGEFGSWWAARNAAGLDVETHGAELTVRLELPKEIKGLTLRLPAGISYRSSQPDNPTMQQFGDKLVIGKAVGKLVLAFK